MVKCTYLSKCKYNLWQRYCGFITWGRDAFMEARCKLLHKYHIYSFQWWHVETLEARSPHQHGIQHTWQGMCQSQCLLELQKYMRNTTHSLQGICITVWNFRNCLNIPVWLHTVNARDMGQSHEFHDLATHASATIY